MAKQQFYGVKYPFVAEDVENYFIDVNKTLKDKVRSLIMHIIFTPKGQKLRDPEFGTDLIRYIFEPNDNISWEGIKTEISESVNKYVNGVVINNISVVQNDSEAAEIYVRLDYSVTDGINVVEDSIATKL
jgi:phage baseplate assembly protein W